MFAIQDYILNNTGYGAVGDRLTQVNSDPGVMRPWRSKKNGQVYVTMNVGGKSVNVHVDDLERFGVERPKVNATTLTKDAWIQIDRRVRDAVRKPLRAWEDLRASSTVGGFDAMGKLTLEYQNADDTGEAIVDMDPQTMGRQTTQFLDLRSIPLPITHSDFSFSKRQMAVAAQGGMQLNLRAAERAARRIAEKIEQTVIGVEEGIAFGTDTNAHEGLSKIYGYTNLPERITKTDLTTPTGTNPEAVMTDVLEMIDLAQENDYYGPYMLYYSRGYSRYFNDDYFRTGSTSAVRLLRERLMAIEDLMDIRRLNWLGTALTDYQLLLIQMTSEVAEAINGMEITTVQWEEMGGFRTCFKVMAIQVPLLYRPKNGVTGIVHGTTA